MEVDVSLTSDLVLVALHDRDLQQLLGQPTAKVGARPTQANGASCAVEGHVAALFVSAAAG